MDTPEYDIAIGGAGPVGCALALILAAKAPDPQRIIVIGKQAALNPPATGAATAGDPRTLALNHGSRQLLEQLGAWPRDCASIDVVHVSQRGRLGRTVIDHTDLGVPRLGSVVAYDTLLASLQAALAKTGVKVINATQSAQAMSGQVKIDAGGRQFHSALAIQSDGSRPQGLRRDYKQHAVLVSVTASRPRPGWAFERFTDQGPLAVLPHPQGPDQYGIVWCCSPQKAQQLQGLDDEAFDILLNEAFGDRLGQLACAGPRHVFPLSMHAGPSLLNSRMVAIGNAAQTLHPVAGQGLNLGLRDAAQLGQALAPWLCEPGSDPAAALAGFVQKRRPDRWLTGAITDTLPRIFATRNPLVQHACGLALLTLDMSKPLRVTLARHLLQGLRT